METREHDSDSVAPPADIATSSAMQVHFRSRINFQVDYDRQSYIISSSAVR